MQAIGTSVGVKLAVDATTNVVTIASQTPGFVGGVMNELIGMVDGGLSTSVGLSHTVGELGKLAIGVKFADKARELPLIGQFLG